MSDTLNALAGLLDAEPLIDVERAAGELRGGRPIAILDGPRTDLVAALDGSAPSLFATLAALPGSTLSLTSDRAGLLGLPGTDSIALPLAGLVLDTALVLALATNPPAQAAGAPVSAAAAAGIALCKHALLLPAVLSAPMETVGALPPALLRVPLERLQAELRQDEFSLEIVSQAPVPLAGNIRSRFVVLRGGPAPRDQVAVIVGDPDPSKPVPVRLHSSCLTGDLFGSLRCDCGDQLRNAVQRLAAAGGGVLLYLDQEGRGIGIGNKMRSYALQDQGYDTIDADNVLGFGPDERRYEYAAAILAKLGFHKIVLLTNNPSKIDALKRAGIEVVARQPLTGSVNSHNLRYLHTKARRADHMLDELLKTEPPG